MLAASLPLFETGKVEALEWSFDAVFKVKEIPAWFQELMLAFGKEGRLIGHGVFFSIFSGKWLPEQAAWLEQLALFSRQYSFDHVTEHFGFMTGEDFHKGAPIGVPFNETTLAIGIDRLERIQQASNCPVGLENLAFSYSLEEVKRHGDFLEKLVEPVNGFIILDLHNLYCQLHNFEVSFEEMVALYPMERVREIHISGGSWEDSLLVPGEKIRRDTHDEAVPETVFELLEKAIPRCPNLKYVVMEQLGTALHTPESHRLFQDDFLKMEAIVQAHQNKEAHFLNDFSPKNKFPQGPPVQDETLAYQQAELSKILVMAKNTAEAQQMLAKSSLAHSSWNIENWKPTMLETAIAIAQKWRDGWE
jgi:uncharacterized protein (UPF0276 family)